MTNDDHAAMVAALAPDAEAVSDALTKVLKNPGMGDRLALSVILALSHKITEIAKERDVSPASIRAITAVMQQTLDGMPESDEVPMVTMRDEVRSSGGSSPLPSLNTLTNTIEGAVLGMDTDMATALRWWDEVRVIIIKRLAARRPGTESRQ